MPPRYKAVPPPPLARTFLPVPWVHFPTMPPLFSLVRTALYLTVLFWSIICLAVAVNLHRILSASELTRFIPFAIFVCSVSLVIFITLLVFGLRKDRNPISTKIELGCLGLAGMLWLALGAFLATSESQAAEVECFASEFDTEPLENGFSTGTYRAQYRVIEAFSLFNAILIWGFAFFLLCLVLRQQLHGKGEAWGYPVTTYPWFSSASKPKPSRLPTPVTARTGRSHTRSRPTDERGRATYTEKPPRRGQARPKHYRERTRDINPYRNPEYALPVHDKYRRNASPRR